MIRRMCGRRKKDSPKENLKQESDKMGKRYKEVEEKKWKKGK